MPKPRRDIGIVPKGFNAAIVKQDADGWKYLVFQRAESETYAGYWGFLTGEKRTDESVAQAVAREIKHGLGLTNIRIFATEYLVQFFEPENDKVWILPLIVVVVPPDAQVTLSDEHQQAQWLTSRSAKHRVSWKNLVKAVDDIADELEIFPAKNWVEIHP
ncbi:MAG: NUDIX domain-containing protein [Candidatus Zixiibacteriota bacterium]